MSVTVIIPTYNRSETLLAACRSALKEPEVSEIVVVDDASSDDIQACFESLSNLCAQVNVGLVLGINDKNMGPGYTRNRGVSLASNSVIAFLDADDEWMEGKLRYQLPLLKAHEDLVIGNMVTRFDGSTRVVRQDKSRHLPARVADVLDGVFSASTPTLVMFKERFLQIGGYDPALRLREDHDLLINHLKKGGEIRCGERAVATRIYDGRNYSQNIDVSRRYRAELKFLNKHKALINYESERRKVVEKIVRLNSDYKWRAVKSAVKVMGCWRLLRVQLISIASYSIRRLL